MNLSAFNQRVANAQAAARASFDGPAKVHPSAYRGVDVTRRNPAAPLTRTPRPNSWRALFGRRA